MPSLRVIFAIMILYVLFLIYSLHSFATLKSIVKVNVTPRPVGQARTTEREVISAYDNSDGTVTINIMACGSLLEVIADREAVLKKDPMVIRVAQNAIEKACK